MNMLLKQLIFTRIYGIYGNIIKCFISLLKSHMIIILFFHWLMKTRAWVGPLPGIIWQVLCQEKRKQRKSWGKNKFIILITRILSWVPFICHILALKVYLELRKQEITSECLKIHLVPISIVCVIVLLLGSRVIDGAHFLKGYLCLPISFNT